MPHIHDLIPPQVLADALEEKYVRVKVHPDGDKLIYNYAEKAAYERMWNEATRQCRGLITDAVGNILARPYPKFFNIGEHDGERLPYLDRESQVETTDKMDGCFPRGTALNLWGGGTIPIDKVVRGRLPVTLVGMNAQGQMVPTRVTDWHDNGRKDNWLDIEVDTPVSRRSGAGGHRNRLRVTVGHHLHINGRYAPAIEVKQGDVMVTQAWDPSESVIHLVRSSLLGDGCVTPAATRTGSAKYQESHTDRHSGYVEALRKALGDCAVVRSGSTSGYGSRMVWAGSREYPALGCLRAEWYPDGVKVVPQDLSWMDDFSVAKWLMDDGHRQQFKGQADRVAFSTHSFSRSDIVRLGDRLAEMYGISYHLVNDSGKGLILVVNSGRQQQIQAMWAAVVPHVHPDMRYKVPEVYQDAPYTEMMPGYERVVAMDAHVTSVTSVEPTKRNFPSGRTGYDISTETENYLARGVLVHNSLGILYPHAGGWRVATRGSFISEQATWATRHYQRHFADWTPEPGLTYLVEIVYPENRIVLDYQGTQDLVLLGAVRIEDGSILGPLDVDWPGRSTRILYPRSLESAVAFPPRDNAEGVVVRYVEGPMKDKMFKVKQDSYVALHRIVTGLNKITVWEALVAGTYADLIEQVPDELFEWCDRVKGELERLYEDVRHTTAFYYDEVLAALSAEYTQKDFALQVQQVKSPAWMVGMGIDDRSFQGLIFAHHSGRDLNTARGYWKFIRPRGDTFAKQMSEDVA
jgi:RNA ligase